MNLGIQEIFLIVMVILIVFGPSRVPELSRALGRSIRDFRKAMSDLEDQIEAEVSDVKESVSPQETAASSLSPSSPAGASDAPALLREMQAQAGHAAGSDAQVPGDAVGETKADESNETGRT